MGLLQGEQFSVLTLASAGCPKQKCRASQPWSGSLFQAWLPLWEMPTGTEAGREGMLMGHLWSSIIRAVAT